MESERSSSGWRVRTTCMDLEELGVGRATGKGGGGGGGRDLIS